MQSNRIFSNPLAIARGSLLLFVYSLITFLYFHYSSHTSEGHALEFFDVELSTYILYFVICIVVSVWMARSVSFNKQVIKVSGILIGLDIIAWVIPMGFVSLGMAFVPTLIYVLILFVIALVIYNSTKILSERPTLSTGLAILFIIILCPVVYASYHDLSVKEIIIYKNNSMFDSIDECNTYFSPIRKNDCRKDWTAMHDRWNLFEKTKNVNLSPDLKAVPGSDNYQYFPAENISDMTIGTGEIAKYDDKVKVTILNANIGGRVYSDLRMRGITGGTDPYNNYELKLSTSVESYDSYVFGVIGMKVGGVRNITFKTSGFWFTGIEPMILVNKDEAVTYTVKLVSIAR